jgi:anti-anti-sigma regulatory factor
MPVIAPGWELKVERGPGWLWVKVEHLDRRASASPPLAEQVWSLMERHFVSRLVLELDALDLLNSHLIGQLVVLDKRIGQRGGLMRLSGLSPFNQTVLRTHGLEGRFPVYGDLTDAVMGACPRRPR